MSAEPDPGALVTPQIWGSTDPFLFPSLNYSLLDSPSHSSPFLSLFAFAGLLGRQRSFRLSCPVNPVFPMVMREHMDREDL